MASHAAKRKLFALPRILAHRAQVALEDYLRLKAEHDDLRRQVARLQKQVETVTEDLYLQFVRIAQMQTGLDEDRKDLAKVQRNSRANESPQTCAIRSTAMSNFRDAAQQRTQQTKFNAVNRCPHCGSVWLNQLFIGRERDWHRCQQCGDTFAVDRPAVATAP
jgi:hypothetical protein